MYGRPLTPWDEVCAAWRWREERGPPGHNRFGVTTRLAGGCRICLNTPVSPFSRHNLFVDPVDEPLS
ncbi:hypothetical protein [Streptomyces atroolivaceus]|uniref:hypothetical protein n=1 Tax=Streptomyces atroolivaceus TaxID=66869 RepID=UPI0020250AF3|nr:hypothetical protein [Streptomyces atroolivaceus]